MNESSSFSSFADDYKQYYYDYMSQDEGKRRIAFDYLNNLPNNPEIIDSLLNFIFFVSDDQDYDKNIPCIESFTIGKLSSMIGNLQNKENEFDEFFSNIFQHIFTKIIEIQPKNTKNLFKLLNIIATKYNSSSILSSAFTTCTEWFGNELSFLQIEVIIRTFYLCAFISSNKEIEISLEYSDYLLIYRAVINIIKEHEDNYLLRLLIKLLDKYIDFFFIDFLKEPDPMEMIYLVLESYNPNVLEDNDEDYKTDQEQQNIEDEFEIIDKQYSHLLYQCCLFCIDLFNMEKRMIVHSQYKIAFTSFYSMLYMRFKDIILKILISNNSIFLKNDLWFKLGILFIKLYDYTMDIDPYIQLLLRKCEQNASTDEYNLFDSFEPDQTNEKEELVKELYYFVLDDNKDPKSIIENKNNLTNRREICSLIFLLLSNSSPKTCLDYIMNGESEQLLIFGAEFVNIILKLKLKNFSYYDVYVMPLLSISTSKLENIYEEASKMVLFMKIRELEEKVDELFSYLLQTIESNENGLLIYMATDFMSILLNENPQFRSNFNIFSLIPKYDEINPLSFLNLIDIYCQFFTKENAEEIISFLISKINNYDQFYTSICKILCSLTMKFGLQNLIMPIYEDSFNNSKAMRYLLVSLLNSPFFEEAFEKSQNHYSVLSFSLLDVFETIKTNLDIIHMIYERFISKYIFNNKEELQKHGFCWSFITLLCTFLSNHFTEQNDLDQIMELFIDIENNDPKYIYQIVMISSSSIANEYAINEYFIQQIKIFALSMQIEIFSNLHDSLIKTLQTIEYSTQYDEEPSLYVENVEKNNRTIKPYEDEEDKDDFFQCLQYH